MYVAHFNISYGLTATCRILDQVKVFFSNPDHDQQQHIYVPKSHSTHLTK